MEILEENYKKAFEWMETAANQGDTDAEVAMAEIYMAGEVAPMNARKAKTWYEKVLLPRMIWMGSMD